MNQELINAGWSKGDAVWCIVPMVAVPAYYKTCLINLPGLKKGYSERLKRSEITGYFPE